MSERVTIYTDGACSGNPGPGGWAALLLFKGREKELSGGEALTTNNRMELTAAIKALQALTRPCAVDLYTDSQYLRHGITVWMKGWKARGWKTADKKPVKNEDLWRALDEARRGKPARFAVTGVIKGWTEGLQLMVEGEKTRFWIPAELAYGDSPQGDAPKGQLTFDVELLKII